MGPLASALSSAARRSAGVPQSLNTSIASRSSLADIMGGLAKNKTSQLANAPNVNLLGDRTALSRARKLGITPYVETAWNGYGMSPTARYVSAVENEIIRNNIAANPVKKRLSAAEKFQRKVEKAGLSPEHTAALIENYNIGGKVSQAARRGELDMDEAARRAYIAQQRHADGVYDQIVRDPLHRYVDHDQFRADWNRDHLQ